MWLKIAISAIFLFNLAKSEKQIASKDIISNIAKLLPQFSEAQIQAVYNRDPEKLIKAVNEKISTKSPRECPKVEFKDNCPESPAKPACWTPGINDVDCFTGDEDQAFGLCCFDGCFNTCLEKTCKNITIDVIETRAVEQCHDSTREECSDVPKTECKQECKDVQKLVPVEVSVPECVDKVVQKCETKESQTESCKTWTQEVTTVKNPESYRLPEECPAPQENPDNCVTNCWSPGVPDVDCPVPSGPNGTAQEFALCCFNGCANRCVTVEPEIPLDCELSTTQECTTSNDLVCEYNSEPVCEAVVKRLVPGTKANQPRECTVEHNRKFAEAHINQPLYNIDLRNNIVWEEKCNPAEKICYKKVVPVTQRECRTVCEPHDVLENVTRTVQECSAQAPRSECHQEMVYKCEEILVQQPYLTVYPVNGHKKSKSFKSKGHLKGLVKRHAKSKGLKKGFVKGDLAEVNRYETNCKYVPEWKCKAVEQPPLCKSKQVSREEVHVEELCREVCEDMTVDSLFEQTCEPVKCPSSGSPAVITCTISLNFNLTTVLQQEQEYCHAPGTLPSCKKVPSKKCYDKNQFLCKKCEMIPQYEEVCHPETAKECNMVTRIQQKPTVETKCEDKCFEKVEKECKMVPFQECHPVNVEFVRKVPDEICEW